MTCFKNEANSFIFGLDIYNTALKIKSVGISTTAAVDNLLCMKMVNGFIFKNLNKIKISKRIRYIHKKDCGKVTKSGKTIRDNFRLFDRLSLKNKYVLITYGNTYLCLLHLLGPVRLLGTPE